MQPGSTNAGVVVTVLVPVVREVDDVGKQVSSMMYKSAPSSNVVFPSKYNLQEPLAKLKEKNAQVARLLQTEAHDSKLTAADFPMKSALTPREF